MVDRARVFAIAGFVACGLAAAFIVASFSSPYWVESNKSVSPSGFVRMGLWEICFSDYYPINRPITNRRYEGCWAAISYEMRDLYDHFFPEWFRAVQVMVTLAMLLTVASVVLNITYFIKCCPGRMIERYSVLISAVLSFVSALFLFISAIMFGVHVDNDRNWLPHPDSTYLSWAFGFCILAAILCLVSGMCLATDFIRLRMAKGYGGHVETRSSRQSARYAAPPPKYDLAVKSHDRRAETAPPSHQNPGYSPPEPDSWHDGKKSHNRYSSKPPPPSESTQYSESESEPEEKKLNGSHSKKDRPSRQTGRYSESRYDDETKPSERESNAGRPSRQNGHHSDSQTTREVEPRAVDKRSNRERSSRHNSRHSASEPQAQYNEETRSGDRHTQRPSRHSARRSEPRSQHDNDMRSSDRYADASHPPRQSSRHSEPQPRSHETRSHSRRGDASPPPSQQGGRHSESQSRHDESKLYDRRSSRTRSPSRHNSHRSGSQSRHEGSRHRY